MNFWDKISNVKREGKIITSGSLDNQDAIIIHLENIKNNLAYPILIEGKKYKLVRSDKEHLWVIRT